MESSPETVLCKTIYICIYNFICQDTRRERCAAHIYICFPRDAQARRPRGGRPGRSDAWGEAVRGRREPEAGEPVHILI